LKGPLVNLSWSLLPPLQTNAVVLPNSLFPNWHIVIGLYFTDAAGRSWKRDPDGRLVELGRRRRSRKDYMNAWIAGELDHLDY
jgi:hypothetical protein